MLKINGIVPKHTARTVVVLAIVMLGFVYSTELRASKSRQQSSGNDVLSNSVSELFQRSFDGSTCSQDKEITLGLWAIAEEKSPVGASATKRIYDEVLSQLLRLRPRCASVIDSAGIGVIIDHLSKSGALDNNGGNVLAALAEAHQNVDLIIFPELYLQSGSPMLALRIVDRVSAKTLAQTAPVALPASLAKDQAGDTAISLEQAMKSAAAQLTQASPDMKEVQAGGIFFEGTGAQPPAGRYIQEQLISALTEVSANVISGKALKIRGVSIEATNPEDSRATELDATATAKSNHAYDLTGRYWIRGEVVDLHLTLIRPDGGTTTWRGGIHLSDFRGMELRPSNPASLATPLPKGNFAFQVTTPHGVSPTYKVGDELQLLVRSGKDAWGYCFYIDSKGQVQPIFPIPTRMAGESNNRLRAKMLIKWPDPGKDKFRFRFNADSLGEELVSCFASNRDVRRDLPDSLFPQQMVPVPFLTLDKLRNLFRGINGAQVAESLVTVTVTR